MRKKNIKKYRLQENKLKSLISVPFVVHLLDLNYSCYLHSFFLRLVLFM